MAWEIRQGDSLHLAAGLPDACLDAIVQDPPAGIDFLHKEWDGDKGGRDEWIAWLTAILKEGYRALKPGAWCVCWAIPRTSHWTSMALENAGFEVKHVVSHLFGSGFPHGLNIGKAMDKMRDDDIYHVTAFIAAARDKAGKTNPQIDAHFDYHGMAGHWTSNKSQPAVPTWDNWLKLKEFLGFGDDLDEEVQKLNGRKGKPGDPWYERPILGWETNGVQGHVFGAGGAKPTYNTEFAITGHVTAEAHAWDGWNTALKPGAEFWILAQKPMAGRNYCSNILQYGVGALNIKGCAVLRGEGEEAEGWPANVVLSHSPACAEECHPSCPIAALDRESGPSATHRCENPSQADNGAVFGGTFQTDRGPRGYTDEGGASRFFNNFAYGKEDLPEFYYCPKATRAEKDAGCKEAGIEPVEVKRVNPGGLEKDPRWAPKIVYNDHATIKSIALMRWFIRLVCPKGGTIGDFFCGSGTTVSAAILEGMNAIGFDLDARNVAIGSARAAFWSAMAEEAAEGGLPLLTLRTASPAALNRPKPRKPAPAFSFEDLFDEDEVAA
jgi:DNA modification methylase